MYDGNLQRARQVPIAEGQVVNGSGKHRGMAVFAVIAFAASGGLSACKEPGGPRYVMDGADAAKGLALIRQTGCGACHVIPGVDWPEGRTGPALEGYHDIGLIAGELPNTPENLASFIRNAPAVKPGSAMPPMPLEEAQARDIAAYLLSLDDA